MTGIITNPLLHNTILRIYSERELLDINPDYQRESDVWNKRRKQLLIDSIINDFDIPKFYFHDLKKFNKKENNSHYEYAVIDGKQRIQAICDYIDDKFPLSSDFVYLKDEKIDAKNLLYSELAEKYPRLKTRFDSYSLSIMLVETDDIELIEDMFSRLNEASPLTAPEKRNALGGPIPKIVREISESAFFNENLKIKNSRFRYREIAIRLLFIEYTCQIEKRIIDTKRGYLDNFVIYFKENRNELSKIKKIQKDVLFNLEIMSHIFEKSDILLRSQANIPIFYLIIRDFTKHQNDLSLNRKYFELFFKDIQINKEAAASDYPNVEFDFIEYNRLTIQGTNDASSIRERYRILKNYLLKKC